VRELLIYDPLRAKMKITFYSLLACLMGLGIASGLGWTGKPHSMPVIGTEAQIPAQAVQPALDLSDAFVNVSETVTPAVVRIEARRQVSASVTQRRNRL
ncbi:uncharacterized protein METZ01_LOCUS332920, partial [marine metagenome]